MVMCTWQMARQQLLLLTLSLQKQLVVLAGAGQAAKARLQEQQQAANPARSERYQSPLQLQQAMRRAVLLQAQLQKIAASLQQEGAKQQAAAV
jgi:hypothetical protein